MLRRCRDPQDIGFHNYGGRGISVCPEWEDYATFRAWALAAGYQPGLTIDRIDNDGNYEPGNCRWATQLEQYHNVRKNVNVTAFGETRCVSEWARDPRCCVSRATLDRRLKDGWAPEEAILCPKGCNRAKAREWFEAQHAAMLD